MARARLAPARQGAARAAGEGGGARARRLIGSGDRSERIRTYNFPQGRVTDHRINLTLYKLDAIMDGDLDEVTQALAERAPGGAARGAGRGRAVTGTLAPPTGTARLALREFTPEDADDLVALDSDPRVMRYIGDGSVAPGRDAALEGIARTRRRSVEHPGTGVWRASRRDDGRFVGWVSLKHCGDSPDIEVGYRLMVHAWGQGFATELARAMLRRGFRGAPAASHHRRHASGEPRLPACC